MPLDQTLVERARQGDPIALEHLLAHCQPDMRRIAHAECASHSDAEDAVKESLWLVYRRIGALRTLAAFPAWMFSIIRRECYRLMHRGRLPAPLPDPDDVLFAYHAHPDLQADLVAAIASLPPSTARRSCCATTTNARSATSPNGSSSRARRSRVASIADA